VHYVYQSQQKGLVDAFVQALKVMNCNETVVLQLSDEIFIDLKTESIIDEVESGKFDFYCGTTYEENSEKIKNNFSVETDDGSFLTLAKYVFVIGQDKPVISLLGDD
jgi:small subunit ribosomal protein S4e